MAMKQAACSLVGFSHGLSASQQCFSLTTNQHQPGLSAQKLTNEHTEEIFVPFTGIGTPQPIMHGSTCEEHK